MHRAGAGQPGRVTEKGGGAVAWSRRPARLEALAQPLVTLGVARFAATGLPAVRRA